MNKIERMRREFLSPTRLPKLYFLRVVFDFDRGRCLATLDGQVIILN